MKVETTRRFNAEIRGSYEVECWLKDWECSILIGALKHYKDCPTASLKKTPLPKGTKTFVARHLQEGLSRALGTVLKAEFADLNALKSEYANTLKSQGRKAKA